jgi:DNA-binding IclR family transcriptional regulator
MQQGIERAVLEVLEKNGRCSVTAIAETLDRHPITVDRQCYDLQVDGYVVIASSGGTYKLTDDGRNRLADLDTAGE